MALGKHLLEAGLLSRKKRLSTVKRKQWNELFMLFSCTDKSQLFSKIGLGQVPLMLLLDTLSGKPPDNFVPHSVIKSTKII